MRAQVLLLSLLSMACRVGEDGSKGNTQGDTGYLSTVDADGDGITADEDCDDTDASVNPGAAEICDGIDNDCDGEVDENVTSTWYVDYDNDGFGDAGSPVDACEPPEGTVANDNDCDDLNDRVYPGAREICDGIDNDCNGIVDDGGVYTWYADADGDGFGDPDSAIEDCAEPAGYVQTADDCDDSDAEIRPDAEEQCNGLDDDCNGLVDDGALDALDWYLDADGDGFGDEDSRTTDCAAPADHVEDAGDCDDTSVDINPDAAEVCDGLDNDCDGLVDDDDSSVDLSLGGTFYADADSDGYGDASSPITACAQPSGTVVNDLDCNDSRPRINPAANEVCDGFDNNCDGLTDDADPSLDASSTSTWYLDLDGDGAAGPSTTQACSQPAGADTAATDCDDADAAVNPSASEVCDGIDNDCDSLIDDDDSSLDASTTSTFYADADADGFGGPLSTQACSQPSGHVATSTDCNDAVAAINPAASEVCDSIDNDCDSLIDDADGSLDQSTGNTYYLDGDSDGYGGSNPVQACVQPSGAVATSTDCNDSVAAINPGAREVCDSIDNDCDGLIDDADSSTDLSTGRSFYIDGDNDGYGGSTTVQACAQPSGAVTTSTDCNDSVAAINPGASEVCDSIDNDCDGLIDDADSSLDASTGSLYYRDADSDGYGGTSSTRACSLPSGHVTTSTDCNDAAAAINPGATEICNGIDDDCDSLIDDADSSLDASTGSLYYRDADSDGYGGTSSTRARSLPSGHVTTSTDCNDAAAAVNPGATEICNGIDDDCDSLIDDADSSLDLGSADTWYADSDLDGYGDASRSTRACDGFQAATDDDSDCDDGDIDVNPAAAEDCNGYDDDCDGVADSTAVCPCDVEYYNGDTENPYMFCQSLENWRNARTECNSYGYELATINDAAEDSWINAVADSYSLQKWWFGLNDRAVEGTFVWASGQTSTYRNWHAGEPNDSGANEDCAQLNRFTDNSWNDEPCSYSFRYICEAN